MSFRVHLALLVWLFCAASKSSAQPVHCPVQESRAMEVDGNAPVITLSLIRADGTRRATRFILIPEEAQSFWIKRLPLISV
jgi:hypothetical protein